MKYIDLTGQKFGRLTVVKRVENYVSPKGQKQAQWLCKCKCGIKYHTLLIRLRRGWNTEKALTTK